MDTPEPKVHSFIVKLWVEESGDQTGTACWRGYITHVPNGDRCYLKTLNDIVVFIAHYLDDGGVRREPASRLRGWLRRFRFPKV